MIDDDAKAIIRTARDVLQDVREHVVAAESYYDARLLENDAKDAAEVLERVDAAIVEADEVLS